ncbi:MAG: hypothetical protein RI949_2312 [Pseudomonadota bacterium]
MGELYRLDFPNGKSYIGITNETAALRFARHIKKANAGQKQAVLNAIRKYSPRQIKVRTLVIADDWGYLLDLERKAIRAFGTKAPRGYNLTDGGEGVLGLGCAPETRAKISAANTGRRLTDEQRAKLSDALRRRGPPSEATRAKLSGANSGKTHSPETRAKCGIANLGRAISDEEKAKQRATVFAKGGGVCFDKARGKWLAYYKLNRKTKILGRFDTKELARAARDAAVKREYPECFGV